MAEISAPLAGEISGHIFFGDRWYGFDERSMSRCRLLAILARAGERWPSMRDRLPPVINTPELRFPCEEARKFGVVDEVRERLQQGAAPDRRHRRRAGAYRGRLVAAARLEHPGGHRRPRRIRRAPRVSDRLQTATRRRTRARAAWPFPADRALRRSAVGDPHAAAGMHDRARDAMAVQFGASRLRAFLGETQQAGAIQRRPFRLRRA